MGNVQGRDEDKGIRRMKKMTGSFEAPGCLLCQLLERVTVVGVVVSVVLLIVTAVTVTVTVPESKILLPSAAFRTFVV